MTKPHPEAVKLQGWEVNRLFVLDRQQGSLQQQAGARWPRFRAAPVSSSCGHTSPALRASGSPLTRWNSSLLCWAQHFSSVMKDIFIGTEWLMMKKYTNKGDYWLIMKRSVSFVKQINKQISKQGLAKDGRALFCHRKQRIFNSLPPSLYICGTLPGTCPWVVADEGGGDSWHETQRLGTSSQCSSLGTHRITENWLFHLRPLLSCFCCPWGSAVPRWPSGSLSWLWRCYVRR